MGIGRISNLANKTIEFMNTKSDFDDLFVCENIIVIVEYSTLKSSELSSHLKKKKILYDKILGYQGEFTKWLKEQAQTSDPSFSFGNYHNSRFKVYVIYASKNTVDETLKSDVPDIHYFDYNIVKYFSVVADAVKKSARYELLKFIGVASSQFGENALNAAKSKVPRYTGAALPEAHSSLEDGFKIITFYIEPEELLRKAYVLRKDGWSKDNQIYQRMIKVSKIKAIRNHLRTNKRVFVNNIIVSLPAQTKLLDENGNAVKLGTIVETKPVEIQLPDEFNSIGIVDGQHRVFAYHEGGLNDDVIKPLREQQCLLVTGILYPENYSQTDRTKFEAKLFLQINANQTSANADIKQSIALISDPYSADSIARRTINGMNLSGPLVGKFEMYFFETKKLKVTSIVSYALRPLCNPRNPTGMFAKWPASDKEALINNPTEEILERYVKFCVQQINMFLGAAKTNLSDDIWTLDKSNENRLLTTAAINGFINCIRRILDNGGELKNFEYLSEKLKPINTMRLKRFKSSQYGAMGEAIYSTCFSKGQ